MAHSFYRSIIFIPFLLLCVTTSKVVTANETHETNDLPLAFRLAFMTGHVKAGLALYRLGELDMAAPHLLHPVSETHKLERMGLEKFGFNSAPFIKVSEALKSQEAASEIESLLQKSDANLYYVSQQIGGNSSDIINFLLDTIIDEYSIAVTGGKITDLGEYQDAYGFQVVVQSQAATLSDNKRDSLAPALADLEALWLDGPLPVQNPTSVDDMVAAVQAIAQRLGTQKPN
ncbi:MAG: hypothetical protein OSB23_10935 [Porticoccaceae bacterium]|nr:hypothetical protein [Porticoccaceae bacterium]